MAASDQIFPIQTGPEFLGTPLVGTSTGGAAANNCTIVAAAGKVCYVQGFIITGMGATAASGIAVSLSDGTNTFDFTFAVGSSATTASTPFSFQFPKPFPSTTTGATWTLNVASFGTGNLTASAALFGYSL